MPLEDDLDVSVEDSLRHFCASGVIISGISICAIRGICMSKAYHYKKTQKQYCYSFSFLDCTFYDKTKTLQSCQVFNQRQEQC